MTGMPLPLGALKETDACPLVPVATPTTLLGALGTPATGLVIGPEETEAALVPTALVAVTVKLYSSPLVSPLTVTGLVAPLAVTAGLSRLVVSVAVAV